jgi:hypothetical protein
MEWDKVGFVSGLGLWLLSTLTGICLSIHTSGWVGWAFSFLLFTSTMGIVLSVAVIIKTS